MLFLSNRVFVHVDGNEDCVDTRYTPEELSNDAQRSREIWTSLTQERGGQDVIVREDLNTAMTAVQGEGSSTVPLNVLATGDVQFVGNCLQLLGVNID